MALKFLIQGDNSSKPAAFDAVQPRTLEKCPGNYADDGTGDGAHSAIIHKHFSTDKYKLSTKGSTCIDIISPIRTICTNTPAFAKYPNRFFQEPQDYAHPYVPSIRTACNEINL